MRLAFIGSGNVAWHLSQALENGGFPVIAIYNRTLKNAQKLALQMYDAIATNNPDLSEVRADIFIICVKDDAISDVCHQLIFPDNAIVVHTSGSQPISILQTEQLIKRGVLYPLQTFSRNREIDLKYTPFCIEAEDAETEAILVRLAQGVSEIVYAVNSEERRILHIAAVFACNFVNHLWTLAKQILDKEQLEFDLLKPLIRETLEKAMEADDPAAVQTGPAVRQDNRLMQVHLGYLHSQPDLQKIYQILSESIIRHKISNS
jgi:predicted short-subunit dehydrogenase-like oxidoreductase (DUF2520 family)